MNQYEPPRCSYVVDGPRIRTDGTVLGKVSGTMLGGIKGLSPWATPFTVACDLLGLGRQDVSNKPAVKTGQVLEERIIDYLGEMYPATGVFVKAKDLYDERKGRHDEWAPDFDDEVFTGHVDGVVMKADGETYILEIKTSSNMASWMDGVPDYYYWQVALYNHFITHQDRAYLALGIVDQETHKDPYKWVPTESNTVLFEIPIDEEEVERVLDEVRAWYAELKETHTTPPYDMSNLTTDVPLYSHLVTLASDEDSMRSLVDEVGHIEMQIDDRTSEVEYLRRQSDVIRARLKDYLEGHDMPEMPSTTGEYTAVMGKQTRRKVSAEKLRDAGIDPDPFYETTTVNTFTIKKRKPEETSSQDNDKEE